MKRKHRSSSSSSSFDLAAIRFHLGVFLLPPTLALVVVLSGPSLLFAQATDNDAENKPKDPFVKNAKEDAAPAVSDAGSAKASALKGETFQNLVHVFEFIEVDHADVLDWLENNPGAPDGNTMRADVQKWIEADKGEVIISQMLMGRSSQRGKAQSVRELIYPTEFDPIQWMPAAPFSVAYETRDVGGMFEVDSVILDGGDIAVNAAPEMVEYVGEAFQRPEPEGTVQEGDVRLPMFQTIRTTLQTTMAPGDWRLLSIENPSAKNRSMEGDALERDRKVLVFLRLDVGEFSVPSSDVPVRDGYVRVEWIDVPADEFTSWMNRPSLAGWIADKAGARETVQALVKSGDADVVFTRLNPFVTGQRLKCESIREVLYATEASPTEQHAPSDRTAFEIRNVGTTVELDPVFHRSGRAVDLNLAPENVRVVGHAISQRYFDLVSKKWEPNVMMPIFYTQRLTTQVTLAVDQPTLIGATMPPDDEGQPDRSRRRLLFITVSK